MDIHLRFSLDNLWVGLQKREAHTPVYKEFPAGFARTAQRLVNIEVIEHIRINFIPGLSIDISRKIDEYHCDVADADACGHYHSDLHDEFCWPREEEII